MPAYVLSLFLLIEGLYYSDNKEIFLRSHKHKAKGIEKINATKLLQKEDE